MYTCNFYLSIVTSIQNMQGKRSKDIITAALSSSSVTSSGDAVRRSITPDPAPGSRLHLPKHIIQSVNRRLHVPRRPGGSASGLKAIARQEGMLPRRRQILSDIRKRAQQLREKIPTVRDVNKIDKYSRALFPSLFVVFNVCYWCFYLLQKMRDRLP